MTVGAASALNPRSSLQRMHHGSELGLGRIRTKGQSDLPTLESATRQISLVVS
jgi:hypothetical protein